MRAVRLQYEKRRRGTARDAFTLVEMMVVIGIILLVTGMAVPIVLVVNKGAKLRQAKEMVKTACLVARSQAISERKKVCVTLLQNEKQIIIYDYDAVRESFPVEEEGTGEAFFGASENDPGEFLRDSETDEWDGAYLTVTDPACPAFNTRMRIDHRSNAVQRRLILTEPWPVIAGWDPTGQNVTYRIGGGDEDYVSPNRLNNYEASATDTSEEKSNRRYQFLKDVHLNRIRTLPEGCRFDLVLDKTSTPLPEYPAFTYVFLPTGGAWTLTARATNKVSDHWLQSTLTQGTGTHKPTGPRIYGPQDEGYADVVVYAMTGQAVTRESD